MDLSVKRTLTEREHEEVARLGQTLALAGIVANAEWRADQWAFHGGSALRLSGRSHRWSEDLDFMLARDAAGVDELDRVMERAGEHVRRGLDSAYPRSELDVKPPKRKAGRASNVAAYTLRWSHPMRQGAVKIKCELYATAPEALARYETDPMTLTTPDGATYELPVGTDRAIWSDKIAAFAGRSAVKWRDIFDLSFLDVAQVPDGEMAERLEATFSVYGDDPAEAARGISARMEEGVFEDVEGFRRDMLRWMPEMPESEARDRLERARAQAERGLEIVRGHLLGPEVSP